MAKRCNHRFTPPTKEEVVEYAEGLDFPLNADEFISFYDARGWMLGKTPMRDWQACVRTWRINWQKKTGRTKVKIPTMTTGRTAKELIEEIEQRRVTEGKPKPVALKITLDDLKEIAK